MTTGLRERKRVAVERALRSAAFTLLAEHHADDVTVEQIAAAADVSTRTFFNYFASKDDLFTAPSSRDVRAFVERVAALPASLSPLQALSRVIGEDLLRLEQDEMDWTLWLRVVTRNPQLLPKFLTRIGETEHHYALAVASRTGQEPESLYPRVVAGCAIAVVRAAVAQVVDGHGSGSVLDGFAKALDMVATGLSPEPTP